MKLRTALLIAVLAAAACAADVPRISFSKSFPGSVPAYFAITVERTGATSYNESEDPDNLEKLKLEPAVVNRIFELADKLDHFKNPLESGLKVANMGMKTVRWEDGGQKQERKFNYSLNEDAKALADIFERIAESTRMLVDLNRVIRHDRLGVNDAILRIAIACRSQHSADCVYCLACREWFGHLPRGLLQALKTRRIGKEQFYFVTKGEDIIAFPRGALF